MKYNIFIKFNKYIIMIDKYITFDVTLYIKYTTK